MTAQLAASLIPAPLYGAHGVQRPGEIATIVECAPRPPASSLGEIQMETTTYDTAETVKVPKIGFVSLGCPED